MSDGHIDTFSLFNEFDGLSHFADKAVMAERISRSMLQVDSRMMYDPNSTLPSVDEELRKILVECSHVLPREFNVFAIRNMDGNYHVFFMDEDGLPINATFDVAATEILDAFRMMCVRASLPSADYDMTPNGVHFHREHHCLATSHVGDYELLSAYYFLLDDQDIYYARDLKVMLHDYLNLPSDCWLTVP